MQRDLQVVLAVGGEHVGLGFREDIQVIMILLRDLLKEERIRRGSGKKGRNGGCQGVG